jgi:hypothetical protein
VRRDAQHAALLQERVPDRPVRRARAGRAAALEDARRRLALPHAPPRRARWCHTQDLLLGYRAALGVPPDAPVEWSSASRTTSAPSRRASSARSSPGRGRRARIREPEQGLARRALRRSSWTRSSALGYRVLLIGGPGARERAVEAQVLARASTRPVSGLTDSVRRMMWMVDGVDVLVSPDTGPCTSRTRSDARRGPVRAHEPGARRSLAAVPGPRDRPLHRARIGARPERLRAEAGAHGDDPGRGRDRRGGARAGALRTRKAAAP